MGGIPRSFFVNPGRGLVQSPIELTGSLNSMMPPGLITRVNSEMTKLTFGIWCKVPKQVIKSKLLSGESILPSMAGLTYLGVKWPILLLINFSEG